jgi:hypothetical protein
VSPSSHRPARGNHRRQGGPVGLPALLGGSVSHPAWLVRVGGSRCGSSLTPVVRLRPGRREEGDTEGGVCCAGAPSWGGAGLGRSGERWGGGWGFAVVDGDVKRCKLPSRTTDPRLWPDGGTGRPHCGTNWLGLSLVDAWWPEWRCEPVGTLPPGATGAPHSRIGVHLSGTQ